METKSEMLNGDLQIRIGDGPPERVFLFRQDLYDRLQLDDKKSMIATIKKFLDQLEQTIE